VVEAIEGLVRGERIHIIRGKLAFDAGRFQEAAEQYRKALDANPGSVTAALNLGSSLAELGETALAAEQFERAIKIAPGNAVAHYNLGVLRAKQDDTTRAIPHLRSALEANPEDAAARLLLARQLIKARQLEEALGHFSGVVETQPSNEDALIEMTELLLRMNRPGDALAALEKGHRQHPENGRTAITLAYLLAAGPRLESRDGGRAHRLAERVYNATGLASHGTVVALALAEQGRCSEAAEWQRRMIEVALRENQAGLAEKLKGELQLFEKGPPCRPRAGG
jgi:tetratricopeptide (TPR) repeat protein